MCIGPDRYESLYHSEVQSFLFKTLNRHTRERKGKKEKTKDALRWIENFQHHLNQVGLVGFCSKFISFCVVVVVVVVSVPLAQTRRL